MNISGHILFICYLLHPEQIVEAPDFATTIAMPAKILMLSIMIIYNRSAHRYSSI